MTFHIKLVIALKILCVLLCKLLLCSFCVYILFYLVFNILIFQDDPEKKHMFFASSEENVHAWVTKIVQARYDLFTCLFFYFLFFGAREDCSSFIMRYSFQCVLSSSFHSNHHGNCM